MGLKSRKVVLMKSVVLAVVGSVIAAVVVDQMKQRGLLK